jgi:hypothetical protein
MLNYVPLISGLTAILGGWLGIWLTSRLSERREIAKRRHEFARLQIEDFYGPMISLHAEIKARTELGRRLLDAGGLVWEAKVRSTEGIAPERRTELHNELTPKLENLVDRTNLQFRDHVLPKYREMLQVFQKKIYLVDPEILKYMPQLFEFIEGWDISIEGQLPPGLLQQIGHSESKLQPLYIGLQNNFYRLQAEMIKGVI